MSTISIPLEGLCSKYRHCLHLPSLKTVKNEAGSLIKMPGEQGEPRTMTHVTVAVREATSSAVIIVRQHFTYSAVIHP